MAVRVLKNYIGGQWVDAISKETEEVVNPATEEVLAHVPLSSKEDVDVAAKVAEEAFRTWSRVAVPQRARILFKYQQLLVENWDELARLITIENGKSFAEAKGEVQRGIECVEFAAGAPSLMMGKHLPDIATGVESAQFRYPVGVLGGITPFNFPMMVPCWMFPLAIACGNTFILKPSERTPLLAEKLVELFTEAGLPAGVLNIVNGARDVVNGFLEHPTIKGISFVGSTPVAEYVHKTGTANGKRVQALAGAKNHSIIMPDANLDYTVKQVLNAAFGSAGERCMAAAVCVLVGGVGDAFMEKLTAAVDAMKVGNGLEDNFLGPVIRVGNKERTVNYIESGVKEGATLVRDGRQAKAFGEKGYFLGGTIFDHVTTDMTIWKDEMFAPVLCCMRVDTLDEAIAIANESEFANGACIYTDSGSAMRQFRETMDSGMLGVNLGVPAPMAFFPFSGWKRSFFGDLHCNGSDGVEFYTRRKMVTTKW